MEKWKDVDVFFFMLQILAIHPPGQKKKKRKEGFSVVFLYVW